MATYEEFYGYAERFRMLRPVDARLAGFSIADWFRSVGTGVSGSVNGPKGLTDCLVLLYGRSAYSSLVNHFNEGTGYANSSDFWQNHGKRNAIEKELHTRFEDWPLSPPGTTYPP